MGGVAEKGSKASAPPPSRRTGKQNKTIIEDVGTGATSNIPNALRFAFFPENFCLWAHRLHRKEKEKRFSGCVNFVLGLNSINKQ